MRVEPRWAVRQNAGARVPAGWETEAGRRRLPGMAEGRVSDLGVATVTALSVGGMDNNAYLVEDRATGGLLLVDAAAEPGRLLDLLGGRPLGSVVTTHRHADHWGALAEVVRATGATTLAGAPDAVGIPVPTDRPLDDGDRVQVGALSLGVVRLTGHTPGGIALTLTDAAGTVSVFTGDSLFPGGVGRTRSPEDFTRLLDDVTTRLFDVLGDDTVVLPGHGAATTLGAERPHLAEWRARGW